MTALQRRVLKLEARLGLTVPEPWELPGWKAMSDAEQWRVAEDYVAPYPHSAFAQRWRALETLTDAELEALIAEADDAFIQRVGVIKVEEPISFAAAFAFALAERLNIPLVTTAHHAFDAVERKGPVRLM